METKDGYELQEGDEFYAYIARLDRFARYTVLAMDDALEYVYYEQVPNAYDRKRVDEVWKERQSTYAQLLEEAAHMDDCIGLLQECCGCASDVGADMERSVRAVVEQAYEMGRNS